APLQISVANIDYNNYVGRMAIGRISNGVAKVGAPVSVLKRDGSRSPGSLTDILTFVNLKREKVKEAAAGEIVVIVGCPQVDIGDTIAGGENPVALPFPKIEEPTLSMHFMVNDSPFSGKEGQYVTSRNLGDRLMKETLVDVALKVEQIGPDEWKVSGRGLLHLGILL